MFSTSLAVYILCRALQSHIHFSPVFAPSLSGCHHFAPPNRQRRLGRVFTGGGGNHVPAGVRESFKNSSRRSNRTPFRGHSCRRNRDNVRRPHHTIRRGGPVAAGRCRNLPKGNSRHRTPFPFGARYNNNNNISSYPGAVGGRRENKRRSCAADPYIVPWDSGTCYRVRDSCGPTVVDNSTTERERY